MKSGKLIVIITLIWLFSSCTAIPDQSVGQNNAPQSSEVLPENPNNRIVQAKLLYTKAWEDETNPISGSALNLDCIIGNTLYFRQYGTSLLTINIADGVYELLTVPEDWRFLRETSKGVVFRGEDSLIITDKAMRIKETMPYPQALKDALPDSTSELRMVVSENCNRVLLADQGGEAVVHENGVTLFNLSDGTSKKVLPGEYYYYNLHFLQSDNLIYAVRTSQSPGVNREFVLYNMQTGETTTIGNDGSETGHERGVCSPYLMFEKGVYNTDTKSYISLPLKNYTITPSGRIFYISEGELFEYDAKTGQSIEYLHKTPIEFSGYHWSHMNTNDTLILFLYDTQTEANYASDLYCFSLLE